MTALAATTEELVARARAVMERHPEILAAYLFGSHAHGLAGPTSDIDLAIYRDPAFTPQEYGWQTYRGDLHAELASALSVGEDGVDVVILNEVTSSLLAHRAIWCGRLIHCRDHRARVTLETGVLQRYLDAAPLRRLIAESVGIHQGR